MFLEFERWFKGRMIKTQKVVWIPIYSLSGFYLKGVEPCIHATSTFQGVFVLKDTGWHWETAEGHSLETVKQAFKVDSIDNLLKMNEEAIYENY